MTDPRRSLPSVHALSHAMRPLAPPLTPPAQLVEVARRVLQLARAHAADGGPVALQDFVTEGLARLAAYREPSLTRLINATGVLLQTNLGRAPLSERAIHAVAAVAGGYSNLEFDLANGTRGTRHEHVRELIQRTTGAEDGLVVNNNAAAVLMVLSVFAEGREVLISRGEAVEIGGGFRIPDVLAQSRARLVEVGTTNRTYAEDYARAWSDETAMALRVHPSNFRILGFTSRPSAADLADLAHKRGGLLVDDLGSGALIGTERFGLAHEPTVQESLTAGADLALFSGDKLLGGPQCGIIAGRTALVDELRRHPLARALRVDKLTVAALNATLESYADGRPEAELPLFRMLAAPLPALRRRALRWARAAGDAGTARRAESMVGGGSLPGEGLPTWSTALLTPSPDALARELRAARPAVVGRVHAGAVLLNPRTVDPRDDPIVEASIRAALACTTDSGVDPSESVVL